MKLLFLLVAVVLVWGAIWLNRAPQFKRFTERQPFFAALMTGFIVAFGAVLVGAVMFNEIGALKGALKIAVLAIYLITFGCSLLVYQRRRKQ